MFDAGVRPNYFFSKRLIQHESLRVYSLLEGFIRYKTLLTTTFPNDNQSKQSLEFQFFLAWPMTVANTYFFRFKLAGAMINCALVKLFYGRQ